MEAHLSHSAGCIISFTFPTILHPNPSHPNSLANLLLVMFEYKQLFWSTLQSDVLLLKLKQNGQLQWKIHLSDDFQGNAVSISHFDTLYPGNVITIMSTWAHQRGILPKAVSQVGDRLSYLHLAGDIHPSLDSSPIRNKRKFPDIANCEQFSFDQNETTCGQALTGTRYPTLPGFYFYYPYPTRKSFENFRVQGSNYTCCFHLGLYQWC